MKSNCTNNKNSIFFFFITNYLHYLSIPLTTTFLVHKSSEINKITFKIQMKSERKRKKLEIIFITPPPYFTQQIMIEHLCTNESINCSYIIIAMSLLPDPVWFKSHKASKGKSKGENLQGSTPRSSTLQRHCSTSTCSTCTSPIQMIRESR